MTMRDAINAAIRASCDEGLPPACTWPSCVGTGACLPFEVKHQIERALATLRAFLEATREPSDNVYRAVFDVRGSAVEIIWRAGKDAERAEFDLWADELAK